MGNFRISTLGCKYIENKAYANQITQNLTPWVNPIQHLFDGCKAALHSSPVLRGFCALLFLGMVRHMQHGTRRRMHEFVELPRSAPRRGVVPARGASEGQARATHLQKREETGLKCSSRASKE